MRRPAWAPAPVYGVNERLSSLSNVRVRSATLRSSAPILKLALRAFREEARYLEPNLRGPPWLAVRTAADTFDNDSWEVLATRYVQDARDTGAISVLPIGLVLLSLLRIFEGKLDTAAALVADADSLIEATGSGRIVMTKLALAACQGDEAHVWI